MEKTTKRFVLGAALAASGLLAAGNAVADEKTLLLGVSDSMSGVGATLGDPQVKSIEMAVGEINELGGISVGDDTYMIETVVYDDKGNPTEATNAVRKLIDRDGVSFIAGFCCSGPTSAVASMIGREDVVMLVGTASQRTITSQGNENLFRTRPPGDFTGASAGTFLAEQPAKRIAVIGALDAAFYAQYLDAMEANYVKGGGEIIAKESFGLTDRDMTAQLTKIKGMDPDAIFVLGGVEQVAFVYRQAQELGINVPRFGFSGGNEQQFLRVATTEQMEGAWDLRPTELTVEVLGEKGQAFIDSYVELYDEIPTPNAPYAYDQVYVLKNAVEAAGSVKPSDVADAIRELAIPDEVVMKYIPLDGKMFDPHGQAYITNGAFQWKDSKWTYQAELPVDVQAYSEALGN